MRSSLHFVVLHLACTLRKPRNWRFHAAGVLREVERMQPALRPVLANLMALL